MIQLDYRYNKKPWGLNMSIPTGSRILITGAAGFLGGRAIERLHGRYDITATDLNADRAASFWNRGIPFVPCDLTERDAAIALCRGYDYVFHCAALTTYWGHYQDYYQSNVQAVDHVIQGCQKGGVSRLIHVSTASIYRDYQDRTGIRENFLPSTFASSYAATKHLSEKMLLRACENGLDAMILRPGLLFGPGDTSFFPRFIAWSDRRFIPLMRGGRALIDMTYVDNAIDAMVLAAGAPGRYRGRAYNISNGQPIALHTLIDTLFEQIGQPSHCLPMLYPLMDVAVRAMEWRGRHFDFKPPWLTRFDIGQLGHSMTLNIDRARKELGYAPRIPIAEGIARFARWWRNTMGRPGMTLPSAERLRLPESYFENDDAPYDTYADPPGAIWGA